MHTRRIDKLFAHLIDLKIQNAQEEIHIFAQLVIEKRKGSELEVTSLRHLLQATGQLGFQRTERSHHQLCR